MYEFANQLSVGELGERELDAFFSKNYIVEPVSPELQRLGIDRIFTAREIGARWSVEYKSDDRAATSGNGFIETVSVDTSGKKGWAYTSCAQILVYYIPPTKQFYVFPMADIKWMLGAWLANPEKYPVKPAPNGEHGRATYFTHGVIVPLAELKQLSRYSGLVAA